MIPPDHFPATVFAARMARDSLYPLFSIEFATLDHWRFFFAVDAFLVLWIASEAFQGITEEGTTSAWDFAGASQADAESPYKTDFRPSSASRNRFFVGPIL